MFVQFLLEGVKQKTSSKGTGYAEAYVKGVDEDGNPDIIQRRFMIFDEDVIEKLKRKKAGDLVNLELEVRDATVVNVGV